MVSGSGQLLGTDCDPGFERTDMDVRVDSCPWRGHSRSGERSRRGQ